jgi:hypothetical protein
LIAAGVLTAATLSTTVAGLAITGTLDKALAASPPQCKPGPVSGPVSGPVQNPGQKGQNPGQKGQNAQCQPPLSLADLNTRVAGSFTNGVSFSVTNLDSNAAGAPGTETFQTDVAVMGCTSPHIPVCAVSGTFTISTTAGTLSGTATGQYNNSFGPPLPSYSLALTVTSASGEFKGATGGTLDVLFPALDGVDITGTVTAA